MENKYAYVTLLSSENYLFGCVALYRSLKETGTSIPFLCACSKSLGDELIERLNSYGIQTYKLKQSAIEGLDLANEQSFSHWMYTFDKLLLWKNGGGEKTCFP